MTDLRIANLAFGKAYIRAGRSKKTVWIFTTQPIKIRCSGKRNSVVAGRFAMAPPIHDTQNDRACFLVFL